MQKQYRPFLLMVLTMLFSVATYSQGWPIIPMLRFGNTVYYKIDSLSDKNITGTNAIFHEMTVTNRYFDIFSKSDSIKILVNDNVIYFHQKIRREPKNYRNILFYSRRKLASENVRIRYLKLIELNQTSIIAEATMRSKRHDKTRKIKEKVVISKSEINGVFLGDGKNKRTITTLLVIGGVITAIILTNIK